MDIAKVEPSTAKKSIEKPKTEEPIIDKPIVEKPPEQKEVDTVVKKEINIDNLFSDVWTKDIKKTVEKPKEKVLDKRLSQEISKKIAKSNSNKVEPIADKIQSLNTDDKKSSENVKTSTADDVNEYLAKIQATVYEHFYPPPNSQGNRIIAIIELNSKGKVIDFRILNYSDNDALNSEADKMRERLLNTLFPENPDNKSGVYKINLTSKE